MRVAGPDRFGYGIVKRHYAMRNLTATEIGALMFSAILLIGGLVLIIHPSWLARSLSAAPAGPALKVSS